VKGAVLNFTSTLQRAALALVLFVGFAIAAAAEEAAPPSGTQQQPAQPLPANALPGSVKPADPAQNPVPDPGTNGQAACIEETGDYVIHGKIVSFVIGLANKCDKRLRCQVFANVTGAKGSSIGHGLIILGAKSSGAAARKTWAMRVKMASGTAQVSRECRAF
jgi:hypothetical protein